jgi:inosine-uridine nucleoside N-ribohydrolase
VVLLIRVVSESRDPVEIVAIGPLTNVARAIERDPRFRTKICRIWAMIGGITYPNAPPTRPLAAGESFIARASHNIRCDVGATRIVLESGIPVVMVGNDVTTRVWFHESDIERVERVGGALNRAVMSLMRVWLAYRSRCFRRPITKTCLHDALVVAEAHGMGFTERDAVDVKVFDDGGTRVTANPDSHIEVCRTVDAEAFERWYIESVTMNRAELPDTRREWRRTGHKEQT